MPPRRAWSGRTWSDMAVGENLTFAVVVALTWRWRPHEKQVHAESGRKDASALVAARDHAGWVRGALMMHVTQTSKRGRSVD